MDIPVVMAHECRGTTAVLQTALRETTIRLRETTTLIQGREGLNHVVSTSPVRHWLRFVYSYWEVSRDLLFYGLLKEIQ
jgi:hypothetical protein